MEWWVMEWWIMEWWIMEWWVIQALAKRLGRNGTELDWI